MDLILVRICTEQTTFDKFYSFIIDSIIGRFSQLGKKVYDETLDLVRVDESKKDWTDKGDHDYSEVDSSSIGIRGSTQSGTATQPSVAV